MLNYFSITAAGEDLTAKMIQTAGFHVKKETSEKIMSRRDNTEVDHLKQNA